MVDCIQAIRGMHDILPEQSFAWRHLEKVFMTCMDLYHYREIRFPILESTQLFSRSIGEVTDIVEKEMYTFIDRNGDSLTLRPEGTAGCIRACIEHGLLYNQQQRLWYSGSMFRHEKPQKGRLRQFHQFGVEALGITGIYIELELLLICQRFWEMLDLTDAVQLQLNTLGTFEERQRYRQALVDYFTPYFKQLDPDSQRRLSKNPLRILDSKNPDMQSLIAQAPTLIENISDESRQHFQALCHALEQLGIRYTVNSKLVRGLDYYGHTVFEWVTDQLGSQATVCAGGRYDKLVEQLGGQPTPAVGFAMGIERLLLLLETVQKHKFDEPTPILFFIAVSDQAMQVAIKFAEKLRRELHCTIQVNVSGGSFKSQFKKADKSGARFAVILGEDELQQNNVSIKDLRNTSEQQTVAQAELLDYLRAEIANVSLYDRRRTN